MKALSGWNPWFYLLVHPPYKDVENRPWRLPKHMIGQRIYVHASLKFDLDGLNDIVRRGLITEEQARLACLAPRGAIIGEITLTGCVTESDSPWFTGPFGFTLADPVAYERPIPLRGHLSFFEVTDHIVDVNKMVGVKPCDSPAPSPHSGPIVSDSDKGGDRG